MSHGSHTPNEHGRPRLELRLPSFSSSLSQARADVAHAAAAPQPQAHSAPQYFALRPHAAPQQHAAAPQHHAHQAQHAQHAGLTPAHEHHLVQHAHAQHAQQQHSHYAQPAQQARPVAAYHQPQAAAAVAVAQSPIAPLFANRQVGGFQLNLVHVGIAFTLVMLAFVMSQGGGESLTVKTLGPLEPPLVAGPPAASSNTPPMKRPAQGIPSAAAATANAKETSARAAGRQHAGWTKGMISATAAATLGPQTLPMANDHDGMSLPNGAMERDGHNFESHYLPPRPTGGSPIEATLPLATPGAVAAQVERTSPRNTDDPYAGPVPRNVS